MTGSFDAVDEGADATLVFLTGQRRDERVPLTNARTVIGRTVGDLLVEDPSVSSIHCIVTVDRGRYWVMDLGSTNGILVDERVVLEIELAGGEELRVGDTILRFELGRRREPGRIGRLPQMGIDTLMAHAPVSVEPLDEVEFEPLDEAVPTRELGLHDGPDVAIVLEILGPEDEVIEEHRFRQESVVLGRTSGDLVLPDPDISRRHCAIEVFGPDEVYARDLDSTNGTRVNGRRITSCRLATGDVLVVSGVRLRFRV